MTCTGIVLAGGLSTRMGQDKALLRMEGKTLAQRAVDSLRALFDEVLVVTNSAATVAAVNAPTTTDRIPQQGPLSGIHAGLAHMTTTHGFFVACDMPWLHPGFIRHLLSLAPGFDAVVPRLDHRAEAMHAVYTRACLAPVEACLRANRRRIVSFYADVRVRFVEREACAQFDPELRMFANVNTPEELERICSVAT